MLTNEFKYSLQRYLNIRIARGATLAPDGKRIAFLSDITGVSQVWRIDKPQSWPEQLTFYEDRVTFVDWSPTGEVLVFGKDEGGNEREQLYLLTSDGESVAPLTEQPEVIHRFGDWSRDGQWIAYAANRRNPAFFDIYIQNVRTRETRRVYQGDGTYHAVSFSPDDRYLLFSLMNSSFDQELYVLELATGDVIHLTQHANSVRYQSPNWSKDGKGIYLVTDKDRDFLNLAYIDINTQNLTYWVETPWDVESLMLSANGHIMVYVTNIDGYAQLTIKVYYH